MSSEQQQSSSSEEEVEESFSDDSRYDPDYNDEVEITEAKSQKREEKTRDVDDVVEENESTGANEMKNKEQTTATSKKNKRREKQEYVRCYVCKKPVWRIISHLRDAHNISEITAKEYRWRRPTKSPKKMCMICGVSRVRLDRHLKREHNIFSKDTRLQYLDAMVDSCPRLKAEKDKLLVAKSAAGMPKVYTPPLFSKRFDFIWD